ncbi:MAG: hypothetical protein HRT90_05765 [Candidatus Margulisbacteria bacterium]|nr:hypothetical protein [Candidatus Margulisiibacteriota bacterium]
MNKDKPLSEDVLKKNVILLQQTDVNSLLVPVKIHTYTGDTFSQHLHCLVDDTTGDILDISNMTFNLQADNHQDFILEVVSNIPLKKIQSIQASSVSDLSDLARDIITETLSRYTKDYLG